MVIPKNVFGNMKKDPWYSFPMLVKFYSDWLFYFNVAGFRARDPA